jgi:heme A synthase
MLFGAVRGEVLVQPAPAIGLSRFAYGLAAGTFFLIVFGAAVRANDAGLACPDWPLCFGEVIPAIDFKVGFEFGHRVLAGLLSLGFLGLGAAILRQPALRARQGVLWLAAAVVLAVQIVLGGLTVLELLAEWTVTSHLVAGNTFCLALLLLGLWLGESGRVRPAVSWLARMAAGGFALLVLTQMILGGFVSSSGAGLACGNAFPSCAGSAWIPTLQGIVGLQVWHRLVAGALLLAAVLLAMLLRGHRVSLVVLGVVVAQGLVGIANVWWMVPVEVTLLHSAGAAALVLTTTWLNWELWRAPIAAASTSASHRTLAGAT